LFDVQVSSFENERINEQDTEIGLLLNAKVVSGLFYPPSFLADVLTLNLWLRGNHARLRQEVTPDATTEFA